MTLQTDPTTEFLRRAEWLDAVRQPLAGDASSRRYERLSRSDGETAILMVTNLADTDSLEPFLRIARHLDEVGLSAPGILAEDTKHGLLLLEDFGDGVFARVMQADPSTELPLYEAAVDVLAHLHKAPLPDGVSEFQPKQMAELASITYDWYLPQVATRKDARRGFITEMSRLLTLVRIDNPVLSLRDFHSENLLWLPERSGLRRVGLLDFQDAFLSHPAYDLVSLLRDARRDPTPDIVQPLIDRYLRNSRLDADELNLTIAVYGAQRNLRILGVFARLCQINGKPHYVDLMPRVWRHLLVDLSHPELYLLRDIILADLPEPTDDFLTQMKARCATNPHP